MTCAHCNRPKFDACDSEGRIWVNDDTVRNCPNIGHRRLALHLGKEIVSVQHVKTSPLLQLSPDGGPPIVDRTKDNIFLKGNWQSILPHLKYTLAHKGLHFNFRVITDERIRNVFVGGEAYKSRPVRTRDDVESNNVLADLGCSDFDLVIIRLGFLGYKNIAAAGALKELLLHREFEQKPTWLVLDPTKPWDHSFNDDVAAYIESMFTDVAIDYLYEEPPSLGSPKPKLLASSNAEPPHEFNQFVPAELTTGDAPTEVDDSASDFVFHEAPGENAPAKKRYSRSRR